MTMKLEPITSPEKFGEALTSCARMLDSLAMFRYVRNPKPGDFEAAQQVAKLVALALAATIDGKFFTEAEAYLDQADKIIDERQTAHADENS